MKRVRCICNAASNMEGTSHQDEVSILQSASRNVFHIPNYLPFPSSTGGSGFEYSRRWKKETKSPTCDTSMSAAKLDMSQVDVDSPSCVSRSRLANHCLLANRGEASPSAGFAMQRNGKIDIRNAVQFIERSLLRLCTSYTWYMRSVGSLHIDAIENSSHSSHNLDFYSNAACRHLRPGFQSIFAAAFTHV